MTREQPLGCLLYYIYPPIKLYYIYTHYIYTYYIYIYTYIYLIPCHSTTDWSYSKQPIKLGNNNKSRSILWHPAIVLSALINCFSSRSQKIYFLLIRLYWELPSSLSKANLIPSSRHKKLKENLSDILIMLLCKLFLYLVLVFLLALSNYLRIILWTSNILQLQPAYLQLQLNPCTMLL